jgi:type II secretory pathway component PulC
VNGGDGGGGGVMWCRHVASIVVVDRRLLHSSTVMRRSFVLVLALATAAPPALAETKAPAPAKEKAKKASLPPFRLVRILPETHQALLLDKTRGKHVLVDAGEQVGGYEVVEIDADMVVLARPGDAREFVLVAGAATPTARLADPYAMPDAAAPETAPASKTKLPNGNLIDPYAGILDPYGNDGVQEVQAPPGQRASEEPPKPPAPSGAKKTSPTKVETPAPAAIEPPRTAFSVSRKELDSALSDFSKIGKQVTMSIVDGGVAMKRVAPDSFFHAMGLRDGDLVRKVDGTALKSLDDAARVYARLGKAKRFEVSIDRAGEPLTLRYTITK